MTVKSVLIPSENGVITKINRELYPSFVVRRSIPVKLLFDVALIIDEPPKEGIPGLSYFNTFDNTIWEYQPIPCMLPYWGNLETLRPIHSCSVSIDKRIPYNIPDYVIGNICVFYNSIGSMPVLDLAEATDKILINSTYGKHGEIKYFPKYTMDKK